MKEECPVQTPKLLKCESTVETCGICGKWVTRYPDFVGNEGFWECEKCGATHVQLWAGRVYGPKSKQWPLIVEWFNDLWLDIPPDLRDTVVTDPPMESIDWEAIEAWYRSQNIYRVHISIGSLQMEVEG